MQKSLKKVKKIAVFSTIYLTKKYYLCTAERDYPSLHLCNKLKHL